MRLPAKSPDWTTILGTSPDAAARPFGPDVREFIRRANAEYWHWDQLRRHPMPAGWEPDELWRLVKLARVANGRDFGLRCPDGEPYWFWLPETVQQHLHESAHG